MINLVLKNLCKQAVAGEDKFFAIDTIGFDFGTRGATGVAVEPSYREAAFRYKLFVFRYRKCDPLSRIRKVPERPSILKCWRATEGSVH